MNRSQGNAKYQSANTVPPWTPAEMTGWQLPFSISSANRIARPTYIIFVRDRDVINAPISPVETVSK